MSTTTRAVSMFDAMPPVHAADLLASCCGAVAWVRGMLGRRPYGSLGAVLEAAADVWWSLAPADWLEAFAHHPRIGEREPATAGDERTRDWSANEQRGAAAASEDVRAAIAEGNREYERRFGHIYLVCATGKTAEEMLTLLRERLRNDPVTELRVAAGEQAKITDLRLRKLLGADPPPSTSTA